MGKLKDLLAQASRIATEIIFRVRIYRDGIFEEVDWTYLELGLYLNSNHTDIAYVSITLKQE